MRLLLCFALHFTGVSVAVSTPCTVRTSISLHFSQPYMIKSLSTRDIKCELHNRTPNTVMAWEKKLKYQSQDDLESKDIQLLSHLQCHVVLGNFLLSEPMTAFKSQSRVLTVKSEAKHLIMWLPRTVWTLSPRHFCVQERSCKIKALIVIYSL